MQLKVGWTTCRVQLVAIRVQLVALHEARAGGPGQADLLFPDLQRTCAVNAFKTRQIRALDPLARLLLVFELDGFEAVSWEDGRRWRLAHVVVFASLRRVARRCPLTSF